MKRALVLAGGGARGAYQVGMLQELVIHKEIDFQIIRGVSVGALNAAFLSQAPVAGDSLENLKKKIEDLHALWTNDIKGNDSVYAERGGFAAILAGADSLYSLDPLRGLINEHVMLDNLRNSGRDFKVGTVSLVSGRYKEWAPDEIDFIDKLVASASIPVVFPFVDFKSAEDVLVDGGVRNISPLGSAFKTLPDEIYVLLTSRLVKSDGGFPESGVQEQNYGQWSDNWLGTKVNGLDVLKRTIDILTDEIYLDDIRGALKWNEVIRKIDALKRSPHLHTLPPELRSDFSKLIETSNVVKKRHVPLYVIAPQEWYGAQNNSTEFLPALMAQAIEHGRMVASDPSKWLLPVQ
ncbi:MAG TPA: patatin-like phospholipase family protein [Thermodesulfovibrionales bacterium]|nr:patatin-like phospholipase family protein [Thermodesulfovibrionales bacterium]